MAAVKRPAPPLVPPAPPPPPPVADARREGTPGQLIPPYELALADFARHLALSARQRTAGRLPGVRPEYAGNRQWGRLRPGRCAVQSVAGVWDGGLRAYRCANSRYPGGREGPRYGRIPKCRALRSDRLSYRRSLAGPWTTPRTTCPGHSPALSAGSMSWRKRDGFWATTASSR